MRVASVSARRRFSANPVEHWNRFCFARVLLDMRGFWSFQLMQPGTELAATPTTLAVGEILFSPAGAKELIHSFTGGGETPAQWSRIPNYRGFILAPADLGSRAWSCSHCTFTL